MSNLWTWVPEKETYVTRCKGTCTFANNTKRSVWEWLRIAACMHVIASSCIVAMSQTTFSKKGILFYKEDDIFDKALDERLHIRTEPVDDGIARLYFVNARQVQHRIPHIVDLTR